MSKSPKITIRKYMGDDLYSWAVFMDGRPVYTGCGRREAQHLRDTLKAKYAPAAPAGV